MIDRRIFLKSSGLTLLGGALVPDVFVRMAAASETRGGKVLVAIFQRGAVDGLAVVVPYAEKSYYDARRSIAIPRPGASEGAAVKLDDFFGAHPSLASLIPFFTDRSLAFVHAVGSPHATRSHFDAQDFLECGTPGVKSTRDGFLARALAGRQMAKPSPLRAVAFSPALPRIMAGSTGAIAMTDIAQFGIRGGEVSKFESMYDSASAGPLAATARDTFEASRILQASDPTRIKPANGASYPNTPLGASLRQTAQLIKANVGLEIAFTDVGGWDTHAAQGGSQGQLANNLRNFSAALAAFAVDLGSRMGDVVVVTMSEFGRTVRENGNRGTDHGHATVMMLLGGGVRGGNVYGKWPGLTPPQLFEGRDLEVTTDFRDVFAELLTKQQRIASLGAIFPRYETSPPKWLGVMS